MRPLRGPERTDPDTSPGQAEPQPNARIPMDSRRRAWTNVALPVVLTALMVVLGFAVGANTLTTLEEVLALVVFATATNLLLGQGGLVSFGQAVFYGIGAYTVALGWMHWHLSFWLTFFLAPLVGALVAVPMGLIALRARRWYFALSTLAFSELAWQLAESRYNFTNGANGVFGPFVPTVLTDASTGYFFLLGITVVSLLLMWKVTRSPFGTVLRATRENRERMQALGVNVYRHQLLAFVVSGFFCSLAGAMFVVYSQSAYPELLEWTTSGQPIFMALIGGMGVFLGPALGAFIYVFGHNELVLYVSDWQLVLGAVLLAIVMFWPDGILGSLTRIRVPFLRSRKRSGRGSEDG